MIKLKKIDYKSSIEQREKFVLDVTKKFPEKYVYLQTCNRAELYYGTSEFTKEIITHLCRVITGLESKIIGETNIHGQVKKAYFEAIENNHASHGLHKLFQTAFRIGKKARTESGISENIVSHSRACFELAKSMSVNLENKKIIVIGAHHTNKKIIRLFSSANCEKIFITNRTDEKAELIAKDFDCFFLKYSKFKTKIKDIDILITATGSTEPILHSKDFPKNRKIIIIDLGVPRNISIKGNKNEKILYYNIEDVEKFIHCEDHKNNFKKAEQIIADRINMIYRIK